VSAIAERVAAGAAFPDEHVTCEAIVYLFGAEFICGDPALGLFTRGCVHEHVRTGALCRDHAEAAEGGFCRTCYVLPVGGHECPILLSPAGAS
jgi:hypothetical protein